MVLIYGISKGLREVFKKKALETSTTIEVLFFYTFISFLLVLPEIRNAFGVPAKTLGLIAVKSLIIFIAWIAGFTAVKNMPVGVYGLLDQMRLIFAMLLGVLVLGERMGPGQIAGLVLVLAGLLLLRLWNGKKDEDKTASAKYVIFVVISCFFNALSGLLDKILMSGDDLTDGQLQFWYMLFLVVYYLLYIIVTRPGIRWKECAKNGWIWVLAILFVVAARCLFIANGYPESRVTVMTLIKQSSCIVTILGGRLFFKEEGLMRKLVCAGLVFAGIVAAALL